MADDVQFYIEAGVRRAVAARELGLKWIAAVLNIEGQRGSRINVATDQLFSTKTELEADWRYHNVREALSTPEGRNTLWDNAPILVQVLGEVKCQPSVIPLKDVKLIPSANR